MKNLELEFGRLLRVHRAKAEITQVRLAMELSHSPSTISRWEKGRVLPPRDIVLNIVKILRLTREEASALLRAANYLPAQSHEWEALNLPRRAVFSQEEELARSIQTLQRLTDQLSRVETAPRYFTREASTEGTIRFYRRSGRVGDALRPSETPSMAAPDKPLESRPVLAGLTPRQREIVDFLVSERGANITDEESAEALCISRNTLRRHMRIIFKKLKVRSKAGLVYLVLSEAGPHDSPSKGV